MTQPKDGAPDEPATEPEPETAEDREFLGPEADTDETVVETVTDETVAEPAPRIPDDTATDLAPAAPAAGRAMRPAERRAARAAVKPAATVAPSPSEQAVHIEDPASRLFVLVSVGVFVAILLNAILLGHGGVLAPNASPSASAPPPSAAVSASPAPSPSAAPSPSSAPSATVAPSPSAAPSASPAASLAPSPAAS